MIGDIISAGGRLIGGFLDRDTAAKNRDQEMRIAQMNMAMQKEFAQEGIRWKVADAKAAGLHPLYALGGNTVSFSPVSISGGSSSNWSDTLGSMGQDISRAVNATRTHGEREDAFSSTMKAIQLEGAKLDNDIKRASLASTVQRIKQDATPPLPGVVPRADKFEDIPQLRGHTGPMTTDQRLVNAEDVEKRYGDLAQEFWGAYVLASDYLNHARQNVHVHPGKKSGTWRDWIPSFRYVPRGHTFKERWDALRR